MGRISDSRSVSDLNSINNSKLPGDQSGDHKPGEVTTNRVSSDGVPIIPIAIGTGRDH